MKNILMETKKGDEKCSGDQVILRTGGQNRFSDSVFKKRGRRRLFPFSFLPPPRPSSSASSISCPHVYRK
jgi:hypothetical protein